MDPIKCAGYTIPAGWTIMVVPAALQLNPDTFVDPLTFNPWRWKVYINFFLNISFSICGDDPLAFKPKRWKVYNIYKFNEVFRCHLDAFLVF